MKKKWVDKEKHLKFYGEGEDLYGHVFTVQDGSWAEVQGIRIYFTQSYVIDTHGRPCLCLDKKGARNLIKALKNVGWE